MSRAQLYATFYVPSTEDQTKLVPARGSNAIAALDGRFATVTLETHAKAQCRKRGYQGWSISKMEMTHPTPIEVVPLTPLQEFLDQVDAARYRWLRKQNWHDSEVCVVTYPNKNVLLGTYCPHERLLDDYVDEAMRKPKTGD